MAIIAHLRGIPIKQLPLDLFIPPQPLEITLDEFDGPIDLLLYLIKRDDLDILDIPVAQITEQYMAFLQDLPSQQLDLAGDYLVMSAYLAQIKSRMLLPKIEEETAEEEDPRAGLARRLLEYQRFRSVAEQLGELPELTRDVFQAMATTQIASPIAPPPPLELEDLLQALQRVLARARLYEQHTVNAEVLSVRDKMTQLQDLLDTQWQSFTDLFLPQEGRLGVIVTFLAILELVREGILALRQDECFDDIWVAKI